MNERLKVEVEAEVSKLDKGLDRGERRLKDFEKTTNKTDRSVNKFAKTTKTNATPALVAFSGIIQDAPYGIRGVANNIEFFAQNMVYLTKTTGGAKGAIKSLVGAMTGPAGILFAVSVVSSLLVTFGDELFNSGEEAKTAEEKLKDYIDSLTGVTKAQLNAATSAAKELTNLRLLSQQATNSALSNRERIAAVNELRSLYPTYLKNMTDEEILVNGLSDAYDDVAKSIMRRARATAAAELMVENTKEELKLQQRLAAIEGEISKAKEKKIQKENLYNKVKGTDSEVVALRSVERAQSDINKLLEERNKLTGKKQGLELENISIQENIKASGDLIIDPDDVKTEGGKTPRVPVQAVLGGDLNSQFGNSLDAFQKKIFEQISVLQKLQQQFPEVSQQYQELGRQIDRLQNILRTPEQILADSATSGLTEFREQYERDIDAIINKNKQLDNSLVSTKDFASIFSSSVASSFSQLGSIAQEELSKSGKAVEILGGILINTATQIISQLLQNAIQQAIIGKLVEKTERGKASAQGVTIATNAAAALGPVGFAALPGLLAGTQAMIQGAFASTQGFASGGIASMVGDKNLARVNHGEMILNNRQQRNMFNQLNSASVGSTSNVIVVEVDGKIENDVIRLSNKRAEAKRNRLG